MNRIIVAVATTEDRAVIYRLRHDVYACELGQHSPTPTRELHDVLDSGNEYVVVKIDAQLVGFVSITLPEQKQYSIDKYFARESVPFAFDASLYEVRILTVTASHRSYSVAALLMYAALRFVEARNGSRIVVLGRRELQGFYQKVGLKPLGLAVQAGAVAYDLMCAAVDELRRKADGFTSLLCRLRSTVTWDLPMPFSPITSCFHGGAFFEAVGETFQTLERSREVINADVLDAWFPPAPKVITALEEHLPWLARTSPPQNGTGLVQTIANVRAIPQDTIVLGAGSSSLIYLALRQWLDCHSRVLLCDPTYGEYAYVLEQVIGCQVDRFSLRYSDLQLDLSAFARQILQRRYDLVVLVNPNNPTGQIISHQEMKSLLTQIPQNTRVWIDEAYIDYCGSAESVETFAATSRNVIVCKSLSKVYALSGLRAAYLCGPSSVIHEIRRITPPWAVSLPAQIAAVTALQEPAYYRQRYLETDNLRNSLVSQLKQSVPSLIVREGAANFLLCHLAPEGTNAATVCTRCRANDVYLRNAGETSIFLGSHTLRIAVKDHPTNQRIVEVLTQAVTR